jgi:hypothetical protein
MFSLPKSPGPRSPTSNRDLITWLVIALALSALACDEKDPIVSPSLESSSLLAAPGDEGGITTLGTIPLPVNQTFKGAGLAFGITQTGSGPTGSFRITNPANTANALLGQTGGSGIGVRGFATGNGARAGLFEIVNQVNNTSALTAKTTGTGTALTASTSGVGAAGVFFKTLGSSSATLVATSAGTGPAIQGRALGSSGGAATFDIPGTTNHANALDVSTRGGGNAAFIHKDPGSATDFAVATIWNFTPAAAAALIEIHSSISQAPALIASTDGGGWAGDFKGQTKGIRITTNAGGVGLQVVNGTKNAVVGTTTGARALYSEESSEVWFTDYGFGRLENGRARILIDPGFAQTVSLDQAYHVFVQPYGDAELYVKERTNLGFVVVARDGDSSAEFGYRLVAKRSGFENQRLERAPWADNSAGFEGNGH